MNNRKKSKEHFDNLSDPQRYKDPYKSSLKYTIDEVQSRMEDALVDYKSNRTTVSYWRILEKHDLTRGYLRNWLAQGNFPVLTDLMESFMNTQQERIIENALNGEFNSGFAKFLLEANYGMMTSYQKAKLDQNQQSIDMDGTIKIGFATIEPDDNIDDILDISFDDDETDED